MRLLRSEGLFWIGIIIDRTWHRASSEQEAGWLRDRSRLAGGEGRHITDATLRTKFGIGSRPECRWRGCRSRRQGMPSHTGENRAGSHNLETMPDGPEADRGFF